MSPKRRIFLHDYGRYAFTLDLGREFSRRGHEVAYAFSSIDTARADLNTADTPTLRLVPIQGGDALAKTSFVKRFQSELKHGQEAAKQIKEFRPDVVLSGNAPLEAQWRMLNASRQAKIPFVYWMQDVLSLAARKILRPKLGVAGSLIADHFERIERKMLVTSDAVVTIAPAFSEMLDQWGVPQKRITMIENWAPMLAQPNPADVDGWKQTHNLLGKQIVLYSGTLGLKHKPELALELANEWKNRLDTKIVIIAEGAGAQWLKEHTTPESHPNLLLLPFQPFSLLNVTLSSADVLLVLLEEDAALFCVPSKTLTYMTAGKPILGAMSEANLAAQLIVANGMGYVANPSNSKEFVAKATQIVSDPAKAQDMGRNAKAYAERTFDLTAIGDRFEAVFAAASR